MISAMSVMHVQLKEISFILKKKYFLPKSSSLQNKLAH